MNIDESNLNEKIIICAFNKTDLVEKDKNKLQLNDRIGKNIFLCKITCIDEMNGIEELLNILKVQISNM